MKLTIVGLGVEAGDISVNALNRIKNSSCVILRTEKTNSVKFLSQEGVNYTSLDYLYDKCKNFETLTKNIVKEIKKQLKTSDVCYVVDGSVSEDRVSAELINKIKNVEVFEGVSKASKAVSLAGLSGKKYYSVSAYEIGNINKFCLPLVVYDLDSKMLASEWKLKLMQFIGEEQKVSLYVDNQQKTMLLYELDLEENFNYSTVLVVGDTSLTDKERFSLEDLYEIIKILRSPNGCPWDKVQTEKSVVKNLIEETYELVEAINLEDDDKMREETGDLLLQVAFYMNFAEERGAYTKEDVISELCRKLIDRHTHIFGGEHATSVENALEIWNKNKQVEKKYGSVYNYVNDVPKTLPSLMRASKVIKRTVKSGLNVYDENALLKTLYEKLELSKSAENVDIGDIIFGLVYYFALKGKTCEEHLIEATNDFVSRIEKVENALQQQGKTIKDATDEEKRKLFFEC